MPPSAGTAGWRTSIVTPTAALLAVSCTLFLFAAGRGFDISDDAYHILSAADAGRYRAPTEAGAFWQPFFQLAQGNLYLFRATGFLFLMTCSGLFAHALCRGLFRLPDERPLRLCAMAAIMTCAFWQYGSWLPTPNYNLLNLGGMLLFLSGVLLASPPGGRIEDGARTLLGPAVLAGMGLCLTIAAKPTTTVAIAVLGLLWIAVWPPRRPLAALLIALATALGFYALLILATDGGFSAFMARKLFSLEAVAVLDRGNSLEGLMHALLGPMRERGMPKVIAVGLVSVGFLALMAAWWKLASTWRIAWAGLLAVVCALLTGIVRARDGMLPMPATAFHVWHFAIFLAMAAVASMALLRLDSAADRKRAAAGASLLVLAPLAYSIGTNTTIALHVSGAAIFWCAAAILLLGMTRAETRQRLIPAAAFLLAALTLGMMLGAMMAPQRGAAPLSQQSAALPLRDALQVRVDPQVHAYFTGFRDAARREGFVSGKPVLDVTGQGPGMVLALGGSAPGVPWLHRGGADVMTFSRLMLNQVPQQTLRAAWIVTGTGPQQEIEAALLRSVGLDFPSRFQPVLSARFARNGMVHILWKPRSP